DKTLNDFATVFTSVEDLGPLAESDQPMTPFFADEQPRNDGFRIQPRLKEEVLFDVKPPEASLPAPSPPAAPAATARSVPGLVPRPAPPSAVESPVMTAVPAPAAKEGEAKANESLASDAPRSQSPEATPATRADGELGRKMETQEVPLAGRAGNAGNKANTSLADRRAEGPAKDAVGNEVANPLAGNGVSAQLDAGVTTQLVEPMLRNRAFGNSNQRGAGVQNRYSLPQSRVVDPQSGNERARNMPVLGEVESSQNAPNNFRTGQTRGGSMPPAGAPAEGNAATTRDYAGNLGPRVSRALIILQRGTPAAEAAPAEPVPAAPAKP
ncbi:MAG TPA: hypothetical protein VM452_15555, partial [Caulifigura sp.]|nr:hypothetical protein [Caulifigura sp.]